MSFFKQLFATPKNPYIPGWDQIDPMEVEFSGCKLRLDLPPRSDPDFKDEIHDHFDIYNDFYEDTSDLPWYCQDNMLVKNILRRGIVIKGKPWRGSNLSYIKINAQITKVTDLPESMSCFNPHHFLQVIDKNQFFMYGPNKMGNVANTSYSVFNNWKVLATENIEWVFFEIKRDKRRQELVVPNCTVITTPIDDNIFLAIYINLISSYEPLHDCLIAHTEIIKTLISKIHLDLSPSLSERKLNALNLYKSQYPLRRQPKEWKDFYIEGWHKDISQKDGEKLLVYPIPQYDPNLKPE